MGAENSEVELEGEAEEALLLVFKSWLRREKGN